MRRDSKFTNLEVLMLGIVYRIQLMPVNYVNQPGEEYRRRAYIFLSFSFQKLSSKTLIYMEIINIYV